MATQTTTETRTPVEIAQHLFGEVLNQRDVEALTPYWAEDIVEEFPGLTLNGRDEVREYFRQTFAAIPDFHIEPVRIAGDDETVFVRWHMTGTFSGTPWMGIEPTGDRIELDGMDCFTMRDGQAVHNFVVYDQVSFGRQIGLLPAQDSAGDRAMTAAFNARTRLKKRFAR